MSGLPSKRPARAGAQVRWAFLDGWSLEPGFEYKNRVYYTTANYPVANDQTGNLFTYASTLKGQITDDLAVSSRLVLADNHAAAEYQSYRQYAANVSVQLRFDVFGWEGWVVSPFARLAMNDYGGVAPPEVYAGFDTVRADRQWGVGTGLEIPLMGDVSLTTQVEYTNNKSNLDRYIYKNFQVSFGPLARF